MKESVAWRLQIGQRVSEAIPVLQEDTPECHGLDGALVKLHKSVASLRNRTTVTLMRDIRPDTLGADRAKGIGELFRQVSQHLDCLHAIAGYRVTRFTQDALETLESARYSQACLIIRALVEHHAMADHQWKLLTPFLERLNSIYVSDVRRVLHGQNSAQPLFDALIPTLEALVRVYGAGRFERRRFGDPERFNSTEIKKDDPYRQVQILKAIDNLAWSGPLFPEMTPRIHYEFLCDYVHPNVGSNFLFIDRETTRRADGNGPMVIWREIAFNPDDMSILLHVLQVVYIPFRESVLGLAKHVERLAAARDVRVQFSGKLKEIGILTLELGSDGL
jgi:hypothetical protein